MKTRLDEKLQDVDAKTESFQNEITNLQKFQESEGQRQQSLWDENGKKRIKIYFRKNKITKIQITK